MFCPNCGTANVEEANSCTKCGNALGASNTPTHVIPNGGQGSTTINVNAPQVQKNGIGTAGFVLALLGIFFFWVPVASWIIWFLGAIFSLIGLARKPKGLATAGVIISFIDIIILIVGVAACSSMFAFM